MAAVAVLLTIFFAPQAFAADPAENGPEISSIERMDPDPAGPGPSAAGIQYGYSASAADLDGDGDDEILTCRCASEGGVVEILGLGPDPVRIGEGLGGFTGDLDRFDWFGDSVEAIGDLNGDGTVDLAVGAPFDDDGSFNRGAVWILFLGADGTVVEHSKISSTGGGIAPLVNNARLGTGIAALGDVDGDGVGDLAVGAANDTVGGVVAGTVHIWLMNADGTVKAQQIITQPAISPGEPISREFFGVDVAGIGDQNGDGVPDVAISASWDNSLGSRAGAIFLVSLALDGSAVAAEKVTSEVPGAELGAAIDAVHEDGAVVGVIASQPGAPAAGVAYLDLQSEDGPTLDMVSHPDLASYEGAALGSGIALARTGGGEVIVLGAPLADGDRADDGALVMLSLGGAAPVDECPAPAAPLPEEPPADAGAPPVSEPSSPEQPLDDPVPGDGEVPIAPPIDADEPLAPPTAPGADVSAPEPAIDPEPLPTLPEAPPVTIPGIPVVAFAHDCPPPAVPGDGAEPAPAEAPTPQPPEPDDETEMPTGDPAIETPELGHTDPGDAGASPTEDSVTAEPEILPAQPGEEGPPPGADVLPADPGEEGPPPGADVLPADPGEEGPPPGADVLPADPGEEGPPPGAPDPV